MMAPGALVIGRIGLREKVTGHNGAIDLPAMLNRKQMNLVPV
jgi:hypothetical protein